MCGLLNIELKWNPEHLSNKPPLEGSPIPITIDMLKKITSEMVSGKAAANRIRVAGDTGATMIHDLATTIICDGKVPTDLDQSFNVCLNLTEHAMKILERIVNGLITQGGSALLCRKKRHCRCNLCGQAAASEIPSSEQVA